MRRSPDLVRLWSLGFTLLVLAAVGGMTAFLLGKSMPVLRRDGLAFLTGTHWSYRREAFGAAPMIYGTAIVSMVALAIAGPLGIGCALFTSEICPPRLRPFAKVLVELLAGIPSVVYGLIGVLLLRGAVAKLFALVGHGAPTGDTLFTAGVLLAAMVLPTIASLCDDALRAVPARTRDGARGLGLTRAETVLSVVLPQALAGIVGAFLLGFGRALGETIAVFLVVGRADNRLPASLADLGPIVDAGQTITSKLGGAETNIAMGDPLHTSALLALALTLLVATFVLGCSAQLLRARLQVQGR